MNKYPTVNYIGNKEKISDWIVKQLPIENGTVLDLFSGGCSVSYVLKSKGFTVISNDGLYSNYVLAKAIIENDDIKLNIDDFINKNVTLKEKNMVKTKINFLENKVYFDYEVDELSKLVVISNKLSGYKKYIFLSLLRRAMIRKIPYSRMNVKWEEIKKFRDEEYSYKMYKRYRHYHNIPFMEHICLNLNEYNNAIFKSNNRCIAKHQDAYDCIKSLKEKVDLIYMDPPYPSTMNKYDEFYGYYDTMLNKSSKINLDLTNKKTFLDNFSKLIRVASKKTKYIAISLNNKCYPSLDSLISVIKKYINSYKICEKIHAYKVTGKENKNSTKELLLIIEMKG